MVVRMARLLLYLIRFNLQQTQLHVVTAAK
jgi:hypothetical protein